MNVDCEKQTFRVPVRDTIKSLQKLYSFEINPIIPYPEYDLRTYGKTRDSLWVNQEINKFNSNQEISAQLMKQHPTQHILTVVK